MKRCSEVGLTPLLEGVGASPPCLRGVVRDLVLQEKRDTAGERVSGVEAVCGFVDLARNRGHPADQVCAYRGLQLEVCAELELPLVEFAWRHSSSSIRNARRPRTRRW